MNKRMTLLQAGLTSKREVRMWYFGETERQAQTALDKIQEENQQAIEQNMAASSQMGQAIQNQKGNPDEEGKAESEQRQQQPTPNDQTSTGGGQNNAGEGEEQQLQKQVLSQPKK